MDKLVKLTLRQTFLTDKLMAENITDEEKEELKTITDEIKSLVEPKEDDDLQLATMTMAEFKEQSLKIYNGNPSKSELELLKRNIKAVKSQGKTKSDESVAVYVAREKTDDDRFDALMKRIDELETQVKANGFDGRTSTGVDGDGDGDEGGDGGDEGDGDTSTSTDKTDAPTAQALALEAIEASVKGLASIKTMIEAGNVDEEEIWKLWPSWEMRELVEQAATLLSKCEEAAKLFEELEPQIAKLRKAGDDDSDEGDSDDNDDSDGDDGDNDDNDDTLEDNPDAPAGKEKSKWDNNRDIAGEIEDNDELYREMKNKSGRISRSEE